MEIADKREEGVPAQGSDVKCQKCKGTDECLFPIPFVKTSSPL